jgi:outer membrane protein insertion porin family
MDGRVSAAILSVVLSGFLLMAAAADAFAAGEADSAFTVAGNTHIGTEMIRSHFHAGKDGQFSPAAFDTGLKSLVATGLFEDVKISHDGGHVVVKVVENPTISRVAFEGNKKIKDDDLKKLELQSRTGGPLWRAYVQGDVERMIELYRQHGYFAVRIAPKTIKARNADKNADKNLAKDAAKNARVDLVFEISEGDKLAVRTILFAGNGAYPANKLEGVVKSGETNVLSFLLDNDIYDADRIDNDCDLLRQFYLAHGYADVRVRSSASYDAAKKGVVLTFTLNEGPQYRLGTVGIESSLKTVDAKSLRSSLHEQSGDVYDADTVNKTVDDLAMQLAKNGEPFAAITARDERDSGRHLIDIVYTIEQGKRLYVERIDIHGNTKTRDDVIRREFDFNEGDAYNRALVDRGERHLKALGYFKTVKIETRPGSAPDRLVLDVTLQEQQTGDFMISGGYSTSMGPLAQISVGDKDFLGTGDIVKASVTYGLYARAFDLAFTNPYTLGQRVSTGVDLYGNETISSPNQSFNSAIYGAKALLGTPLTDQLGVTWNYSIYNQSVSLNPANGISSLPVQQAAAAGPMWVSSIGNSVVYSTLDTPKDPSDGVRVQTTNDLAGLGGAAKFARTTEDVRYYHQIVGDVVGMVRAQGGYVTPWGGQQLPLLDGFFGGPQLIRGFAPNGFGPRDITSGTTMDNLGGNVYWTSSAELQAPVPLVPADAKLKAALFSDVGSLWANNASSVSSLASLSPSQQIANSRALRASVGASLIWDSMFGPIRVNYAYPIAKQPYDVTQRFSFSAGGF